MSKADIKKIIHKVTSIRQGEDSRIFIHSDRLEQNVEIKETIFVIEPHEAKQLLDALCFAQAKKRRKVKDENI